MSGKGGVGSYLRKSGWVQAGSWIWLIGKAPSNVFFIYEIANRRESLLWVFMD